MTFVVTPFRTPVVKLHHYRQVNNMHARHRGALSRDGDGPILAATIYLKQDDCHSETIAQRSFVAQKRMRYVQSAALSILLLTLLACGSLSVPTPQTVNGTWNFELTSSAIGGSSYTGSAHLNQIGNDVTGTVTFTNAPCAASGSLTGTVSGLDVSFQIKEGSQVVTLIGTINSVYSSMSGTYTGPPGGCLNGDHGSWAAGG